METIDNNLSLNNKRAKAPNLKTITDDELAVVLHKHKCWVESNGEEGQQADLRKHDLSRRNLSNVNLQAAKLSGSSLYSTNLESANLEGAKLSAVLFIKANLSYANLTEASLGFARFKYANCKRTRFQDSKLVKTNFDLAELEQVNFINVTTGKKSLEEMLAKAKVNDIYISNFSRKQLPESVEDEQEIFDIDTSDAALKELELSFQEKELNAREEELNTKEQKFSTKEEGFSAKEREINRREGNIKKKEQVLNTKEQELRVKEKKLITKENEMNEENARVKAVDELYILPENDLEGEEINLGFEKGNLNKYFDENLWATDNSQSSEQNLGEGVNKELDKKLSERLNNDLNQDMDKNSYKETDLSSKEEEILKVKSPVTIIDRVLLDSGSRNRWILGIAILLGLLITSVFPFNLSQPKVAAKVVDNDELTTNEPTVESHIPGNNTFNEQENSAEEIPYLLELDESKLEENAVAVLAVGNVTVLDLEEVPKEIIVGDKEVVEVRKSLSNPRRLYLTGKATIGASNMIIEIAPKKYITISFQVIEDGNAGSFNRQVIVNSGMRERS